MPKNETGEFELVLGNRQLLSGFAVVAILFGVFFAMGYIVGRNSTPSARLLASDTQGSQSGTNGTAVQPDAVRAQSQPPAQQAPPSAEASAAQPPAPAEAPPPPPARPPETAKLAEKPPEAAPSVQSAESLQTGTYLQVIATIKTDAEVISKSLQERRFPAVITPSSLEGRFRVLVGPYRETGAVGGAKTELENLGFHPIAVKIAEKN
jgi:cell division septation protein DedD